jgi:hypothetical protein
VPEAVVVDARAAARVVRAAILAAWRQAVRKPGRLLRDSTIFNEKGTPRMSGKGKKLGHYKHEATLDEVRQSITQDAAQDSTQANIAAGNLFFLDLNGEHNHVNLNKARFVLASEIEQTNAVSQAIGQEGANTVAGIVTDKQGRVVGTVEVEQSIDQSASQDSVQVNGAIGNVLRIDLSGEHNHANLNKATFVLESDIEQVNLASQEIEQEGTNAVAAPVTAGDGRNAGVLVVDDAFQFATQDAAQENTQLNAALGNLLAIDLSGEHNHANLNKVEFELASAIDQVNASSQSITQEADNTVATQDWVL